MSGFGVTGGGFGNDVPGNPTTLTSGASATKPSWFRHAGGNKPKEGFMGTVGVPPASLQGPPGAASMAPSPDMPLETMGLPTNHSAPYAKIARRLAHEWMLAEQNYQILVEKRESKDPVLKRKNREARRYTILNIPAFNYFLALNSKMPTSPKDVQTAQDILAQWSFSGIARTEEGKQEQYYYKEDVSQERLFNNVVRGYAYTFNVFGTNARPSTRLFLIIKKVPIKPESTFKLKPWDDSTMPVSRNNRTPLPFQVTFFGDWRYDKPPIKSLEYKDEFGFRHVGAYIYIGRVSTHSIVRPNYRDIGKCAQDLATILMQPQFHVHVDW